MSKVWGLGAVIMLAWLVMPAPVNSTSAHYTGAPFRPGIVLVGVQPGASSLATARLVVERGLQVERDWAPLPVVSVRVPIGQETATAQSLQHVSGIGFAELDWAAHTTDAVTPDDPDWPQQWGPVKIRAPLAWSIVTGTPDVVIAVVDSGVQLDHPDLTGALWINPGEIPGNGIDDDGNGKIDDVHGWHFFQAWTGSAFTPAEDANVRDDYGHGTHVSGIAAATMNNGVGIAGIAGGTRLMPVKVLDQYGYGWYSDIAAGIVYAADSGAKIINLSLGGAPASAPLCAAAEYADAQGALVVAAAGNTGGAVYYPAACEHALAIAATDANDRRAYFSNYGPQVDLAAPGVDIYSTWCRPDAQTGLCLGNYYFTKSGTSMAAPHVSGVAALMWSRWPDLTANQVVSKLLDTADDVGETGADWRTGWGRVNAYQAVTRVAFQSDVWIDVLAPASRRPGDALTYTLRYGNRGGGEAYEVAITDTLPAGVVAAGPTRWSIGALASHSGPYTLTLPVTVTGSEMTMTNVVGIYPADGNAADFAHVETLVSVPALADFAVSESDVAVNRVVTFTNLSTGSPPLAFLWNLSDGVTSTLSSLTHAYVSAGWYTATLVASNMAGSSSKHVVITVGAPAVAGFTSSATDVKVNQPVTFTNTSAGTAPLTYRWTFGDGLTSTLTSPTHRYSVAGTCTVTLQTTNGYGTDTATVVLTVGAPAVVGFTSSATDVKVNQPVTFTNTSAGTGPLTYQWDMGDGSPLTTTVNITHVYTRWSVFTATLTVSGMWEPNSTSQVAITVTRYFTFLPIILCAPSSLEFGPLTTTRVCGTMLLGCSTALPICNVVGPL